MKIFVYAAIGMALCACGSSPNTAYYSLAATSGTVRQASLGTIEVRRPGIAGYLDRTEILAQWDGQRLQLTQGAGWAEPITAMIGRVLAEDIGNRLPGTVVFNSASELSIQSSTVVEVLLRKFDLASDGHVYLNALWLIRSAGQTTTHSATLKIKPTTTETAPTIAAMSALLGQLADKITTTLLERATPG
jgi:uncharacterized lipoprotein YmbA